MPRLATSLLALLLLLGNVRAQETSPAPPAGPDPLDIGRIRELHHLTEVLGDRLWPGFDTRKIPVAVNLEDRREILVGHPSPPIEYQPLDGVEVSGMPVLLRDGISRYGPRGDLLFESQEVPIIFRQDYLEWIDPDPAPDASELQIEFEAVEDEVYTDLRLTTDGFTLTVPRARIERREDVVSIFPLP